MSEDSQTAHQTQTGRPARVFQSSAVSLLALLHLCLTIPLAYKLNIRLDEAFTLNTTGQGIAYAFRQALRFEVQPPLYFVVLNLWRKLDGSIFFARLFSVACAALTIYVVAALSRRFLKEMHPGWLAAAVAFHPFLIWTALDVRVYAPAILLSALLLLFFHDGYLAETPRRRARFLYLLLAVASLYTHYYLGFLLAANACALIAVRRWRALLDYLLGMCVVALCFAPMALMAFRQAASPALETSAPVPFFKSMSYLSFMMKDHVLPVEGETWWLWLRQWLLRAAYVVLAVLLVKNRRHLFTNNNVAAWTIAALLALSLTLAHYATGEGLFLMRHTAALFVPLLLAVFLLLKAAGSSHAIRIYLAIFFIFSAVALTTLYRPTAKAGDWQRVARHLMASEKPGQPIMVFHAANALPLSYYYQGQNALVPVPREDSYESYDPRRYVLTSEDEIVGALKRVPGEHEEVWLVMDDFCRFLEVDFNCGLVEEFVNKYYTVESTQDFYRARVRLLRRKPEGKADSPQRNTEVHGG